MSKILPKNSEIFKKKKPLEISEFEKSKLC